MSILCTNMPHQEIIDAALWWCPTFQPGIQNKNIEEIDPPCEVVFLAEIVAEKENFSKHIISFLEKNRISMCGQDYVISITNKQNFLNMTKINTMQQLADYINNAEEWPLDVEDWIEENYWISDTHTQWGVCHNDTEKCVLDDTGKAIVISI